MKNYFDTANVVRLLAITGAVLVCLLATGPTTACGQGENASAVTGIALNAQRRASDDAALARGDLLGFMEDEMTFKVADFAGDEHQKPDMGCELSDFGSWYDVAYCGGINRFWMNSVRHHTYDQVGFNATPDVGMLSLFFRTASGELIDGGSGECSVKWYPYGWTTTTRQGGVEVESTTFFSAFNTVVICNKIINEGTEAVSLTPFLLVTGRSEYDGMKGGMITGAASGDRLAWRNMRIGKSSAPKDYTDSLLIGSTLGRLNTTFLPQYLRTGRGDEMRTALGKTWASSLESESGSALCRADAIQIVAGEACVFSFYIAAGPDAEAAAKTADAAARNLATNGIAGVVSQMHRDWNDYLKGLPKLYKPSYEDLKLYYSSALALRTNRLILKRPASGSQTGSGCGDYMPDDGNGATYDASCPGRGAFNLFFQSDSCWNTLGYLDINPGWAAGHAVPMLEPVCIIMDPHYYWSMWEMYSRLTDPHKQKAFAEKVYPLLKETYRVWTTQIDIDHNLLCATPNNWDDGPRADLVYKEATDIPGQWNSWWTDWVNFSRDRFLEDPASSSQLAYGTVVMERFAKILGKPEEAAQWNRLFQKHVQAIDTLWDEKSGYWIVTYKHSLKDTVKTSSIIYPIFTDTCRDTAKIRRVIEGHILNPAEFNGRYPVPTIAYNDPLYYRQKPPRTDEEGGLWRGNIWIPEAWVIVKGLYKYGYEAEADDMVRRLTDMMSHQTQWSKDHPQFGFVPSEYYDSRTGEAKNNRRFSWTSAVAMDFLLGNYQNERVLGTNAERDRTIHGHIREIFDFESGRSLFRVRTDKSVFPLLQMTSADKQPINQSAQVDFSFSDPAGNFSNSTIYFIADTIRWQVVDKNTGVPLQPDGDGYYEALTGVKLALVRR
jgi:hypothetical protein